jgi:hypothetical protein
MSTGYITNISYPFHVEGDNFAGKFHRLQFGENKPRFDWYRYVRLDFIFLHDPYLDAGQEFPLWTNG